VRTESHSGHKAPNFRFIRRRCAARWHQHQWVFRLQDLRSRHSFDFSYWGVRFRKPLGRLRFRALHPNLWSHFGAEGALFTHSPVFVHWMLLKVSHIATCCGPRRPRQAPQLLPTSNVPLENVTGGAAGETALEHETCVGTSFEINSSWSIIQTKSGEIYAEYQGDPCDLGFYTDKKTSCSLPTCIVLTSDKGVVCERIKIAIMPILHCPNQ